MKSQTILTKTETSEQILRLLIVESLTQLRKDWQRLTPAQSLVDVDSSVGLLLSDIAQRLTLTPKERFVVLGRKLAKEVETFVDQPLEIEIVQ